MLCTGAIFRGMPARKAEPPDWPGVLVSLVEEGAQMLASRRVTQLAQCLGFDLADTFTGDIELLAHFLEGVVSIHVDTEAHAQNLGFTGGKAGQYFASGFLEAFDGGHVDRGLHGAVLDEVAKMRIF